MRGECMQSPYTYLSSCDTARKCRMIVTNVTRHRLEVESHFVPAEPGVFRVRSWAWGPLGGRRC